MSDYNRVEGRLRARAREDASDAAEVFWQDVDAALDKLNRRLTDGDRKWIGVSRIFNLPTRDVATELFERAAELRTNVLMARFTDALAEMADPNPAKAEPRKPFWKLWL
jgi:hypothetical protein